MPADEFIEFGGSGRLFDKTKFIEALQHELSDPAISIALRDFTAATRAGVVLAQLAQNRGVGLGKSRP